MSLLEVKGLRKSFGSVKAVEEISFEVKAGEVFTIIGPNGAGKTTTLEMIEGLIAPDAGTIIINGLNWDTDADKIKYQIGVQPQSSALFELLTVEENLDLFASFYLRPKKVDEVLEMISMNDNRSKRVKSLSGGQRQRLAIGLAMISDPQIIFLDEPTTGLDPQARRNIWDIVLKLKELGKTTILTTHYMEEAEKLSDRVCIVDQGRIVTTDTPAALIDRLTKEREVRLSFIDGEDAAIQTELHAQTQPTVVRTVREGMALKLWSIQPEETLYGLFGFTKEKGYRVEQVSIREMSLEDVFIAFTGKEWRD
ncbi:ABC transporter ATP-binding protein [Cohnella abietis]|uniref:ABC transporter ATP-binding protein n=1 Tax=Cohnella abietis TaxID=2507935 RepID=A0A3T1D965_9BACL|nr:ABC transporter ATP-binding protein [Cohnella abietis]BBI34642.1 ABC transporter ATP-binding protein [Cohnella abietis]